MLRCCLKSTNVVLIVYGCYFQITSILCYFLKQYLQICFLYCANVEYDLLLTTNTNLSLLTVYIQNVARISILYYNSLISTMIDWKWIHRTVNIQYIDTYTHMSIHIHINMYTPIHINTYAYRFIYIVITHHK